MSRIEFHVTVHISSRLGRELALLQTGRERSVRIQELATQALYADALGVQVRETQSPTLKPGGPSPSQPDAVASIDLSTVSMGFINQLATMSDQDATKIVS